MRLIYCIPTISTAGGVERIISIKANWLASRGYQVHIVCVEPPSTPFFTYDDKIQIHFLNSAVWTYNPLNPNHKSESTNFINLLRNKWYRKKDQAELARIFSLINPNIIICALEDFSVLDSMLAFKKKSPKTKLILEAHMYRYANYTTNDLPIPSQEEPLSPSIINRLRSRLGISIVSKTKEDYYRAMDMLVALTEEDSVNYGRSDATWIPNPVTLKPIVLEQKQDTKTKTVLAVGRYCREKNFEELVHIWKSIASDYPDWRLRIIGPSVPEGLKAIVSSTDNIDLLPSTKDLEQEYIQANIFALTSKTEGFGIVLVEAQTFGVPAVSYNCPCGPASIITNGLDGYLVETANTSEFANRLRDLMNNEELRIRLGKNAQISSAKYTLDSVMTRWENLFKDLLYNN